MARVTVRDSELVAQTSQAGEGIQSLKVVVGGAVHPVSLKGLGLSAMANADYRVLVHNEALSISVDESTITAEGFTLIGGAAAQVAHVLIHGKLA